MKKIFKSLLSCVLALTLCVGAFGCDGGANGGANQVLDFDRAFYYTAIGGIGLMNSSIENEDIITSANSGSLTYSDNAENLSSQEEKKLVANAAIAIGTIDREVFAMEEKESDRAPYELTKKVIVSQSGGSTTEYDFYYTKQSFKTDDSGDIRLEGIIIINKNEENLYIFKAEKEIEKVVGDINIEVILWLPENTENTPVNSNTSLTIKQKYQFGKQTFRYEYYYKGERIVETTAVYEKTEGGVIKPYFFFIKNNVAEYYDLSFTTSAGSIISNAYLRKDNADENDELLATVAISESGYSITYPTAEIV